MLLKISLFVLGIIACSGEDPCQDGEHRVLKDDYRNVRGTCLADLTQGRCDQGLVEGWYAFKLMGQYADIPTNVCIMPGACGTQLPMRLLLNGSLPEVRGEEMEAVGCTAYSILGAWDCCVLRTKVIVRSCGAFRVYRLQPTDRCPVSYCAQMPSTSLDMSKMAGHSETVKEDSCPADPTTMAPTRSTEVSTTSTTVSSMETTAAASITEGLATTTMASSSDVTSTASTLAESSTTSMAPGPDVTTDLGPGTSTTTPGSADTTLSPSSPGESSTDTSSSVSTATVDMGLGTSTTASDSETDSTSVSATGTTALPTADTTSAPGVDTTAAGGVDTTSVSAVDTTSAAGVDTTSVSAVDTTSASVTVTPFDSATSTVSESDTVTPAVSGMSTDSDSASTALSDSDTTTALSPGDVSSEVVRTLFTTSVSDDTSGTKVTSASDVMTSGDLQDTTETPSATTGAHSETAAPEPVPGDETSSPAPTSVSTSAAPVSRTDDLSNQTTTASPASSEDAMQGDTTTVASQTTSPQSTDVISGFNTTSATTAATSTSTSAVTPTPTDTPTDTTTTPASTPTSTMTSTRPTPTPSSPMTRAPISTTPKPPETRLQLVFDVQDKTVTIANFQEELQAAFNRMLSETELEPADWTRFQDYPDSRAANSTLNPEGVIFVSVVVRDQSVPVVAEKLKRFLDNGEAREFLEKKMMLPLVAYCVMGDSCSFYRRPQGQGSSVFERNLPLFAVLIVLAVIILLVLAFGLLYYRYRYQSGSWVNNDVESKAAVANGKNKGRTPGSVESPLSDAEIMKDEAAVEKETPLTSNGAMGADVDNSVVPYPDTEDINAQAVAAPDKMEDTKL